MSNPIIKIEGISKKYRLGTKEPYYSLRDSFVNVFKKKKPKEEFWALEDINFEVEQGETIGIIGRNGAGKSTLLKILSRITPPTKGKITMRGRVASLLEVGTGFNPELTGRENIYLNGAILGMTKKEIGRKFDEIVAFSEIEKFLDTPVKRYSSGMYVRLAFAVAAHLEPEILVVDEVLAVGDANFQKKCLGKMNDVSKKDGRTVLFVSHNMGAVKQLCNRSMLLENGKIKTFGETEKVLNEYLNGNTNSEATIEYPEDSKKKVQIIGVDILDENEKYKNEININNSINIKVKYLIKEKIKSPNFVCINFFDAFDNILFQAFDIDTNENYYEERESGYYLNSFRIPANTLNKQILKIGIYCGIPTKYSTFPKPENYYDIKEFISINLTDAKSFSKKFFKGERRGPLLLKIPCEITKLR